MSVLLLVALLSLSSASALDSRGTDGRFSVGRSVGRDVFLTPEKKPFWSLGVCCTDPGQSWSDADPSNPSYRAYAIFPTVKDWVNDTNLKLKAWGFNTLGGWSAYDLFRKHGNELPYTIVLHLGAWNKAPWKDMFAEEASFWAEHAAREQITPVKDDPRLIGYFTDNELGWWDDTLFLHYLKALSPTEPGRKRAHAELRLFYKGSFQAFRKDWETPARSWDDFEKNPQFTLKPGQNGIQAVNHWMSVLGDHYGQMVQTAIHKVDKTRLILGERYVQYYNQSYAKAASKYCDVVSTNAGANWTDGTYCQYFLDTLHNVTGKPVLITEFYMAATENRSGNKNTGTAFPVVKNQRERAIAVRKCLDTFASRPYIVGAHWFQYHDEPTHGRGDGEDFNFGLEDIHGKPYEELIDSIKGFDPLNVKPDVPRTGSCQAPWFKVENERPASLQPWPRRTSLVPSASPNAFSDLYCTWSEEALSFGLYAVDYMDLSLYKDTSIPESERPQLTIQLGNKTWVVRYGGWTGAKDAKSDLKATVEPPGPTLMERPDLSHTLIVSIPKDQVPFPLRVGAEFQLKARLASHSRSETMSWDTKVVMSR